MGLKGLQTRREGLIVQRTSPDHLTLKWSVILHTETLAAFLLTYSYLEMDNQRIQAMKESL